MSEAQVKVWHECSKGGWQPVESDPCSGRPAASGAPENDERVRAAINKDQWLSVWELEADLGLPETLVSQILTQDLGMKCVMGKFVPWLLPPEPKGHHAAVANDLTQTTIPIKDFAECFEQRKRCWENCVRSQGAYFQEDWGIIVLFTMFLVSSSINVSIFQNIWLGTFQTLLYDIRSDSILIHFLTLAGLHESK